MAVPTAPVLRIRSEGLGLIRLRWEAVADAVSYNLYRGTTSGDANSTGRNEQQTVTISATGGTFKLTYAAQQTAAIAFDATAQAVEDALVALSNVAAGDVHVTKAGSVYTVEFTGLLARTNVAQMTSDATSLTGGAHTAVVATSVAGIGAAHLTITSPYLDVVTPEFLYYYTLRAVNASGESDASNEVHVYAGIYTATEPSAPAGVPKFMKG